MNHLFFSASWVKFFGVDFGQIINVGIGFFCNLNNFFEGKRFAGNGSASAIPHFMPERWATLHHSVGADQAKAAAWKIGDICVWRQSLLQVGKFSMVGSVIERDWIVLCVYLYEEYRSMFNSYLTKK